MKLALKKYSYRLGEELLKKYGAVVGEVEGALLQPASDVLPLSGDEYAEMVRDDLLRKGWESEPAGWDGKELVPLMDFRKERVGFLLGFESTSSPENMVGFETARKSPETEIDIGIYATTTVKSQRYFQEASGKSWAGPNFDTAIKGLKNIAQSMLVPVCIEGVGLWKAQIKGIDLNTTSASKIKGLALSFLESEYGVPIVKHVLVQGKTRVLEFDGITRVKERDVLLALEMNSEVDALTSWIEWDRVPSLLDQAYEYREISGRDICVRFVLLGDFGSAFMQEAFGSSGSVSRLSPGVPIECELYPLSEIERYLKASLTSSAN
ncbi:MAG: hypothetical protein PHV74_05790 [Dehalococcoidia bacterium]|nr:hypothetical protein [Dehalococcoidia bacterium]